MKSLINNVNDLCQTLLKIFSCATATRIILTILLTILYKQGSIQFKETLVKTCHLFKFRGVIFPRNQSTR